MVVWDWPSYVTLVWNRFAGGMIDFSAPEEIFWLLDGGTESTDILQTTELDGYVRPTFDNDSLLQNKNYPCQKVWNRSCTHLALFLKPIKVQKKFPSATVGSLLQENKDWSTMKVGSDSNSLFALGALFSLFHCRPPPLPSRYLRESHHSDPGHILNQKPNTVIFGYEVNIKRKTKIPM